MKANMSMVDGFGNFDEPRLAEIFAKRDDNGDVIANEYVDGYVPLTTDEKALLQNVPVAIVGRDFFQNYNYAFDNASPTRKTEFFNPQTLRTNHWLHAWAVISSSPFENACVFTTIAQAVSSVVVSPATATITKGQSLQLSAIVTTTGFANKAVYWSVDADAYADGVRISDGGELFVPSDASVTEISVTATSIFDNTKTGTATITVA
jgi:hypothetical protein